MYGIDVSHHQTNIDWNNLALYCDKNGNVYSGAPADTSYMQPVLFVYIKATEGATEIDPTYHKKAIEAEKHGITKGAYHYMHMMSSVDDQIKNFFKKVTWTPGDLPPALDLELTDEISKYGGPEKYKDMALEWLEKVEARLGVRPIIYTSQDQRRTYFSDPKFNKYKIWISRYSTRKPDNPNWQIWQKTETGKINGNVGVICIDLFHDDYESFKKFLEQ